MNAANIKSMTTAHLLEGLCEVSVSQDVVVTGLSEYSADVEKGDLFIALTGLKYCQEAVNNGAVAILCQTNSGSLGDAIDGDVVLIECDELPECLNEIISRFYGEEAKSIKTVAITGTDGKSSVAHLVTQALDTSGDKCGLIGTLGMGRLNKFSEATHTTPPRTRISKEYSKFKELGCNVVALEASSHGILQGRLQDLSIHTAVLTNITRDHMDYHKTLEDYIEAKAALFFKHNAKFAVINMDDEIGSQWCETLSPVLNVVSYSMNNEDANVYASNVNYLSSSTSLKIHINKDVIEIHVALLGEFNVLNLLAVAAVLLSLNKSTAQIAIALNQLDAVPGRMQMLENYSKVIVDYAHTPAALHAAIKAVRQHSKGKLICVFGCGGDRDQGKRPLMGEVATSHCDYVVITSDNPRSEFPQVILDQIVEGCVSDSSYITIVDRKEAIKHALHERSDVVLIAGKGHEKFQYIDGERIVFDDVYVARNELQRIANGV